MTTQLLSLQREYGNAAVTEVVQRRERPQSTDAPQAKGAAKPGKPGKKPVADDFAPKTMGEATKGREPGWLIDQGNKYLDNAKSAKSPSGEASEFHIAESYFLGLMWIDPSPTNTQYLVNLYDASGDKSRKQYWLKVQHKEIVLPRHKAGEEAVEDMTGKSV